ncbi:hypothetical protein HID58_095401 [Brassica napus]|uniref:Uncharacterized protein n=1 Tax=Brassica napus TaxID=3708 RepID=A0ABQ7X3R4_BRANA|nr:hypothetical protein HID58_095401 [Brassica napus]
MNDLGFISDLLSILRKPSCPVTHENAVVIVFNMCDRNRDRSGRLKVLSRRGESIRDVYKACEARIRSCSEKSGSNFEVA